MLTLVWIIIVIIIFIAMIITAIYHLFKPKDRSKDSVNYNISQGTDKDTLSNKTKEDDYEKKNKD